VARWVTKKLHSLPKINKFRREELKVKIEFDSSQIDDGHLIELHKLLLKVRHAEENLAGRYREQQMRTPTHFGTGQEAVAVGVCAALNDDDVIFSHHRCHNHYLAKGGKVYELAAELYGRADGCSGGRGGSVHLTDREKGVVATSAILGETPAVAAGAALSFQMDGLRNVSVTFFGEGAMDEGAIYEVFNFSSLKGLPILFVCENNLYATESPLWVRQPQGTKLCERAEAFKIPSFCIDGNDVAEVYAATTSIVEYLRAGNGPVFLECMTYRWREHVGPMFDHELNRTYRTQHEVEFWMDKCPVKRSAAQLVAKGIATQEQVEMWQATTDANIKNDIERAANAPWPSVSTLFEHI
tara:strand:+ start:14038 stop:15102 length:1065 start_codon:yes stop_codon:yes gene_type:complete